MAAIFGKWNICWNLERQVFTVTLWVKNFSHTVKDTSSFVFYSLRKLLSLINHQYLSHVLTYPCQNLMSPRSLYEEGIC